MTPAIREPSTETSESIAPPATPQVAAAGQQATLRDYFQLLRPTQWIKNVVVYAAPAASLKLFSSEPFFNATVAFVAFCLAASATYAINDVIDRRADAKHPTKRYRPVARGAVRPSAALALAAVLVIMAVSLTYTLLSGAVTAVLLTYFALTLSYSLALKQRVLLDVIIVATGFVLRALAGTLAVQAAFSLWLVACVFTLCLFMGFGKRRCELSMINNAEEASQHRRTLVRYTPDLLTHLITVSAGIAVITFLLYTLDTAGHPAPFPKEHLFFTLPIVIYGIFRYAMLTEIGYYSGPTEIILKDRALGLAILAWAACALVIVYQVRLFGPEGLEGFLQLRE